MRAVLTFAGFALAAGLLVPHYAAQFGPPTASRAPASRPATAVTAAAATAIVVVPRDARGQFNVEGRVGGTQLGFMIDTGASVVALTAGDAARLGIRPDPSQFTAEVRTANGNVRAAPTRLDVIEVGDLVVRDVPAVVLPDGALSENLLGLSFLARLRRFEYSDGKLVLEQ